MKFVEKLFFVLALLVANDQVLAQNNVELNWVAGFSNPSARVTTVTEGDVLTFRWGGYHDVVVLPTKEAFDACDFSRGERLGRRSPISYTMTGETTYFACSVGGHCRGGQKLEAIVSAPDTDPPTGPPTNPPTDPPTDPPTEEEVDTSTTIVDLAVATDELSTLVALVTGAGLADTLSSLNGEGPFTVFAPTNDAFAHLPADVLESLTGPENIDALINVLTYHVVGGATILSTDLAEGAIVTAVNGGTLNVTSLNPPTINNESVVVQADIVASNGVVHVIDTVLVPGEEGAESDNVIVEIDWLAGFVDASARVTTLREGDTLNFTWRGPHDVVVLPTREAFDACDFSQGVNLGAQSPITYTMTGNTTYFACSIIGHCGSGQKLEAIVTADADIPVNSTIVDLAVETDELSTLVELVTAAGLVETLSGEGPFTVFAPTNDAFAALPADVLASVTGPENIDALVNVLSCHVVGDAAIFSTDLERDAIVTALNGDSLTVTSLDPPTINESRVILADIRASNGVVHVIDTVILPAAEEEEESSMTGNWMSMYRFGGF